MTTKTFMPRGINTSILKDTRDAARYENDPDKKKEWDLLVARLEGYFEGRYHSNWHRAITQEEYDSIEITNSSSRIITFLWSRPSIEGMQ